MAQLAIKGHKSRGNEVIEILEMLGGKNKVGLFAKNETLVYFIKNGVINNTCINPQTLPFKTFTLEEFLEKYPYKVGDKVQHKGATSCGSVFEVEKMRWEEDTVKYTLHIFGCNYKTSTLPAEYLQPYKEETMEEKENSVVVNIEHKQLKVNSLRFDKTQLVINDKYELKQERDAYYIVCKQPQYPKTYKECCEVLSLNSERATWGIEGLEYKRRLIVCFQRLLICRDAYWKLAVEQMGWGKPWEYDMSKDEFSFAISYQYGHIQKCEIRHLNKILIFPTKEMRDAFYENFKELIELVKELL